MLDTNTFPPNVSLSPMNTSFLSPGNTAAHMEQNSMMMYSQQAPSHVQHQQGQNQMPNMYYRQPSQPSQQPMYNNFAQLQPPPSNQVPPNYHSMQQQQQPSQQRVSTGSLPAQMSKRQALMHQQRTSQQNNQQLQLHMSMNVTLPHVSRTIFFHSQFH